MLKHILFDLDHTLWDFDKNSNIAMHELFRHYKFNRYFSSYEQFISLYKVQNTQLWDDYAQGRTTKKNVCVDRFYQPLKVVGIDNYSLATEIGKYYLESTSKRKHLLPYALETLRSLHYKYQLHIVTNGFQEVQYSKINNSGIGRYINEIFISDEVGAMKPTKSFFDYVFKRLNTNATECVIVGDNPESDIRGALEIGMRGFLYNTRHVDCPFPIETIKSLRDLTKLL